MKGELMMNKRFWIGVVAGAILSVFMISGIALAAAKYPEKPITIVAFTAPGGGGDLFARQSGKGLQNILGKTIITENRPGGSGAIAMQFAATARPDGYTLLGVTNTLLITPLRQETPKRIDDFIPIARVVLDPMVLYVRADSKYDTNSFLNEIKNGDGNLKIGCPQAGSPETIAIEALKKQYGGKLHMVPFTDSTKAMTSVLGGDVVASMGELAELNPQLLAKSVKILFGLTSKRIPQFPDMPTFVELGFPNVVTDKFRGLAAPKGTPPEVIKILEEACKKVLDDPDYKKLYTNNLQTPAYLNGPDFGKFMKEQEARYKAYFDAQKK
jgi:putative tricarboxylic transport membrane protein